MESFLAQRTQHVSSAEPGLDAGRALSAITDEAVRELSRAASSPPRGAWAIVALGGWGSGALLPSSDLDILVLSDAPAAALKPFVEAILYPLWDAGLKVGHQVRSPKQQIRACREDLKTLTSALTGRPIAGDTAWAGTVLASCARDALKHKSRVLGELQRRERPGSPWLLEPDLKEGAGGRRDYDELTWTAAVLTGSVQHDPRALIAAGVLGDSEHEGLRTAASVIARARWELQRAGAGDRLDLDAAQGLISVDAEELQRALGVSALTLAKARARLSGRSEPPSAAIDAQQLFARLSRGADELLYLELAGQSGALDTSIPGMSRLMSVRRPGLGHQLTVGAHCLKTASLVLAATDGDGALRRSASAIADPRVVQTAALTHDLGKSDGGAGHAERGAVPAAATARSLGLSEADAQMVANLVRLHLVLVETALRDDLDDEDAVLRCAARIGSADLLAPLHLLTAADSLATGPATWTPWTAALVGTLVARLDAALSPEVDGAGIAARGELTRTAALDVLSGDNSEQRAFVSAASLRYLASRPAEQVVRDARLVAEMSGSHAGEAARIAVSAGPADGTHAVTVVAHDRPQLLARLAGAAALAGLDILAVDAYAAPGHLALDSFVVSSATRRPLTPEVFSAFERFVRNALNDRLELATRLAERRRHYPPRSAIPVSVDTSLGGWDTTVRVTAPDRPGLLHDVALAVSSTGVDIRWAKAHTVDGIARDTFHVVGPDGGPIDDPGVLGHLAMRIRESA